MTPVLFSVSGRDASFGLLVEFVQFLGLDVRQVVSAASAVSLSTETAQFVVENLHTVSSNLTVETGLQVRGDSN